MEKRKFTWIDGVVAALILLLIAGTCFKFFYKVPTTVATEKHETLRYTISGTGVRKETVDILRIGDEVYDSNGNTCMGKIVDIQAVPAVELREYPDGTLHEVTLEDRYDMVVTIEAKGTNNGDHYQIGNYPVRVNRPGTCNTLYTVWIYRILSLG